MIHNSERKKDDAAIGSIESQKHAPLLELLFLHTRLALLLPTSQKKKNKYKKNLNFLRCKAPTELFDFQSCFAQAYQPWPLATWGLLKNPLSTGSFV